MSRRTIVLGVVGLGAWTALAWGIHGLMLTGSCGGDDAPPCPPEAVGYLVALIGGVLTSIVAAVAGGRLAGAGVFPAIGIGALWAGLELPAGSGTTALVIGGVFLAVSLLPLLLVPYALRRRRRHARIVTDGVAGIGTVLDVGDTGVTINGNPRVALTVRIEPQNGDAPFEASKKLTVPRVDIPRRGQRFPVWFLPEDPNDFAYGVHATEDASPEVRRLFALAAEGEPAAEQPAERPAAEPDPLDRLAKLHQLHLTGALTKAEFETQKARLLAGD